MKGSIQTISIADMPLIVYAPPVPGPVPLCIYLSSEWEDFLGTEQLIRQIMQTLEGEVRRGELPPFLLTSAVVSHWDDAYSPWPADCLPGRHFSGGAEAYFGHLQAQVHPFLQRQYGCGGRSETLFLGYSLAGVSTLTTYLTPPSAFFGRCASISGSLWYPGWLAYLRHTAAAGSFLQPGRVYLSLGKGEIRTRNPLFLSNKACYEETARLLGSMFGEENVLFEWTNGKHGYGVPDRHIRAIRFLLQPSTGD